MRNYQSDDSNSLYKSALIGSRFGVVNTVLVFTPLLVSLWDSKPIFIFYIVIGLILLGGMLIVALSYSKNYNYDFTSLRYLYYLATLLLVFFTGIFVKIILKYSFNFSGLYLLILEYILIVMSCYDIYKSAHAGIMRMKTLYLRTIKSQYFKIFATVFSGVLTALIFLTTYLITQ